jgi:hypothetical protein
MVLFGSDLAGEVVGTFEAGGTVVVVAMVVAALSGGAG